MFRVMSRFCLISLITISTMANSQSLDGDQLLSANACTACHAQSSKMVGPSFDSISARYGASAGAVARLARSIKAGGAGKWGPIPMPAQNFLSDSHAEVMAAHILGYRMPTSNPSPVLPPVGNSSNPIGNSGTSSSIEVARKKCEELGFKSGTEAFGNCVLKLSE